MKARFTNPRIESLRASFERSPHYRKLHGQESNVAVQATDGPAGLSRPSTEVEPAPAAPIEYDPNMSVEDYERYCAELMEP